MREDVIRAHAELPALCEHIHLPLQSGSSRDPQGDAPHLRPRALPGPRRADPRARARLRAHDRHHRRLPGRDRGGLRADARGRARRSATTAPSPSSSRRGAAPRRRRSTDGLVPHEVKVERMERLVEVVQRRAHERAQRFVGRTLDVLVEGPSRTDPSRLRGRSRHNKTVNFAGLAAPGEIVPVEIHSAHEHDAGGRGVAALARGGRRSRLDGARRGRRRRRHRRGDGRRGAVRGRPRAVLCARRPLDEVVVELPDGSGSGRCARR